MKLYHGTVASLEDAIMRTEGLSPRLLNKRSNWEEHPSREDCVYLSRAYAPYFAMCAVGETDELPMIVEVDTDRLDELGLLPDEDALEQVNRHHDGIPGSIGERTAFYRDELSWHAGTGNWKVSVGALGNCCYLGTISPDAITRVAVLGESTPFEFKMMILDPTITLANYRVVGDKYRNITDWIFGSEEEWEEGLSSIPIPGVPSLRETLSSLGRDWITIKENENVEGQ